MLWYGQGVPLRNPKGNTSWPRIMWSRLKATRSGRHGSGELGSWIDLTLSEDHPDRSDRRRLYTINLIKEAPFLTASRARTEALLYYLYRTRTPFSLLAER